MKILALLTLMIATSTVSAHEKYRCEKKEGLLRQSLFCEVYDLKTRYQELPDFDTMNPIGSFRLPQIDVNPTNYTESFPYFSQSLKFLKEDYGIVCEGFLKVQDRGDYTFYLTSDDGARIRLDHKILVEDNSLHAPRTVSAKRKLKAGLHPIRLEYYQGPRDLIALKLEWEKTQTCACNPSKNLLTNGSLDETSSVVGKKNNLSLSNVATSSPYWDVFASIPGWTTTSGAGIEIQKAGAYTAPRSGKYVVELDSDVTSLSSHTNSAMTQKLSLAKGSYVLKLAYIPRTNVAGDSVIQVLVDDVVVSQVSKSDPNTWTNLEIPVSISKTGTHSVTLKEVGQENSLGSVVDDISLTSDCGERQVISKKHIRGIKNLIVDEIEAE